MPRPRPSPRTCPICGIGLIASDQQGEAETVYHCPRCRLIIDVSLPAEKPGDPSEAE